MEIQPASMAQVKRGKDGRSVLIEDDVLSVARGLLDIDPALRLRYNENGRYFVVYVKDQNGDERLVLTSRELDPRILERVREIQHPSYDYVGEIERMDARAEKDKAHRFHEQVGERGEIAAHALRRDLQAKSKVFVPKEAA